MRLPWPVVGVLADDDHLDAVQRRAVQRIEDQGSGRIDHLAGGLLGQQEFTQLLHVRLLELIAQRLFPVLGQLYGATAHDHCASGTDWALQRTTRWRLSTSRPDRPLCRVSCRIITPSTHSAT